MYWRCRGRFSRQLVVFTKQSMLKRLHSLGANATCGIADADYTEWRNFNPLRTTIRPSTKNCLLYPNLTIFTFYPPPTPPSPLAPPPPPPPLSPTQNFFLVLLENKTFFWSYFHQIITIFSHDGAMKEKKNKINLFFPTYLPTQPKQYRVGVQQTNTFLRMALWILFLANMPIIFNVCVFEKGSARLDSYLRVC